MDSFIHTANGELISKLDIPGTKVRRKTDLPFAVHTHFPIGEVKTIGKPCGKINEYQDPKRPFAHIPVEADPQRGIIAPYCFHAYADTLDVIEC